MSHHEYAGSELELFAEARRWKAYWARQVRPYVLGDVLEVGAGIGANTRVLCRDDTAPWVCLEPDPSMARRLEDARTAGGLPGRCRVFTGTLGDLPAGEGFDAVLYLDVLEHIQDDSGELAAAASRLRPGGHLVVLAPAHGFLYSDFDRAIGHFRRYDRRSLLATAPGCLRVVLLRYLDVAGIVTSLVNRILLRQDLPTRRQLAFWDRVLVPVSRALDPATGHRVGRSILAVWRR